MCLSLFFNFSKFLKTPFPTDLLRGLLLDLVVSVSFFLIFVIIRIFKHNFQKQSSECVLQKRCFACNFIKKETLVQVFSCEFCEISKNTFFYRTPLVAASAMKIIFCMVKLWKDAKNGVQENCCWSISFSKNLIHLSSLSNI